MVLISQGMELGDLERFQKRHNFFKYLGGLKELPTNLKKQLSKQGRKKLLSTLTDDVPLGQEKKEAFRDARKKFDINPARSFACGDEHKDYRSAIGAGMHPLIVSYGFEDFTRLTKKFDVPEEVISRTPDEFCARILHTFNDSVSCRGSK